MRGDRTFAYDLVMDLGAVSGRVALLLRSTEAKPTILFSVFTHPPFQVLYTGLRRGTRRFEACVCRKGQSRGLAVFGVALFGRTVEGRRVVTGQRAPRPSVEFAGKSDKVALPLSRDTTYELPITTPLAVESYGSLTARGLCGRAPLEGLPSYRSLGSAEKGPQPGPSPGGFAAKAESPEGQAWESLQDRLTVDLP